MSLTPDSPEFARLATRWLDGLASADEASRLFAAVRGDLACARAFADMARFELLLEQTSQQVDQERAVAAIAVGESRKYKQRRFIRRCAQIAAVFALLGVIVWQWPQEAPVVAQAKSPTPHVQEPVLPAPPVRRLLPTTVVMSGAARHATTEPKALSQTIDDFFLSGLSFDKLPLREAIRLLREQLHALNFNRRAELDQLLVSVPAEASEREVSFHAGAISFLKALQAIASLADCDVVVGTQGIALSTRKLTPQDKAFESRNIDSLLAAHQGANLDVAALRAGLLADARALGMQTDDDATFSGTKAQFEALQLMLASRAQINALPNLQLLAFPRTSGSGKQDEGRVLTQDEASQMQAAARQQGISVQSIAIKPSTDDLTPEQLATFQPGEPSLIFTVQPVGDGPWKLTIIPNTKSATVPDSALNPVIDLPPIDAIVPTWGGVTLPASSLQKFAPAPDSKREIAATGPQPGSPAITTGRGATQSLNGSFTANPLSSSSIDVNTSKLWIGTLTLTSSANAYAGGVRLTGGIVVNNTTNATASASNASDASSLVITIQPPANP